MFNFFESIGGFISTIVGYVIDLFDMLLNLIKLIFKAQTFLIDIVTSLPPFLLPFALIIVAIAILYQILNKGS